jgi:hypothetical protein
MIDQFYNCPKITVIDNRHTRASLFVLELRRRVSGGCNSFHL